MKRVRPGWLLALVVAAALCLIRPAAAVAHETRPAVLELRETAPERYDVLWRTPLFEGQRLPFALRFPEDVRQVTPPLLIQWPDWHLESWRVAVPGGLVGKTLYVAGHDATTAGVVVRLFNRDGTEWSAVVTPNHDRLVLGGQTAAGADLADAVQLGVRHILYGPDHLLFVLGLLCLAQTRLMLVKTVTAFTLAHSLTLAAATLGLVVVPVEPVNAVVGLSILFLGPEIVRMRRGQTSLAIRRPYLAAFTFGLLHGLGFAGGLTGLGLSRDALVTMLVGFNLGVEIGQLAFVGVLLAVSASVARLAVGWPHWLGYAPAYLVGSAGAYFTIARTAVLLGV
ncbi:HupE/UreJ family protein [Desulfovibrio aerotolerans]|uniref:HupE/UreJ family protein n=1 Tax=Solidesulfovibrio aerotolerans TaxID=295255 RepID=A0A7C9MDU0_9BACT|nr:HupE/UreJ family protein [Solidesulfovibrio aerotolerans]MYL82110.1 HupE/UreJ family protein [Solidesulfovibrio aerotolerans]